MTDLTFREKIWKTEEGEKIKYKDLTDSHLNNIIKHLEKRTKETNKMMEEMNSGLPYPEQVILKTTEEAFPYYRDLWNERYYRKINKL